ncbi:hypothetical protein V1477_014420 [Vespula maculifrons]|uniref:Uncharacterized protein n=1 Tax=Vespula maculifrons TaxID=7453 RepID=A0ABD2BKZ6_VESMC
MVHSEKYGKVVPPSKEENMGLVNKDTWSYQIWMGTVITGLIEYVANMMVPSWLAFRINIHANNDTTSSISANDNGVRTSTIEICTWFSQKARISTLFEESSEFQGGKPEFVEAVPY